MSFSKKRATLITGIVAFLSYGLLYYFGFGLLAAISALFWVSLLLIFVYLAD